MIEIRGYYQYNTGSKSKIRVYKLHKNEKNKDCYFVEWADGDIAKMLRAKIMDLIVEGKIHIISKVEFDKAHDHITEQDKDLLTSHFELAY